MMAGAYDEIVIGAGGVGSAAVYYLAKRGRRVLAIDRFAPPHERGSSHGQTRIIRQAYFEHPDYVPLVMRAYELWRELEAATGTALLEQTGLLQVGPRDGNVVRGVMASAAAHGLNVDVLSADELQLRFAGFRAPPGTVGVFERDAGVLRVDACVDAHLAAARSAGAEVVADTTVLGFARESNGFVVKTDRQTYRASRLVIAAGPWAASLLSEVGVPLLVRRKPVYWLAQSSSAELYAAAEGCPAFLFELPAGVFYGTAAMDGRGVKVAKHSGGDIVGDPAMVDRTLDAKEFAEVERFLAECLPAASRECAAFSTCMYTMSPDEHFIVGRHPAENEIAIAAGLSGHGFKFTPVLGEILADLAIDGATRHPIDFLSPLRFGS